MFQKMIQILLILLALQILSYKIRGDELKDKSKGDQDLYKEQNQENHQEQSQKQSSEQTQHHSKEHDELFRLSNNTAPLNYSIDINVNIVAKTFTGHVKIILIAKNETNEIKIHSKYCKIKKIVLAPISSNETLETDLKQNGEADMMHIYVSENLATGETYELNITYSSHLREDKLGFFHSSYTSNRKKINLAATQFSPIHARHAFPCYDEPSLKATFNITLTYNQEYHAISNMDIVQVKHNEDEKTKTTIFKPTPVMSTYLVGFIISDLDKITINRDERFVLEIYAKKDIMKYTDFVQEYASNAYGMLLDYFENATAQPIKTLKQVLLPELHSIGEANWGMITYRESNLIYNKNLHSGKHWLDAMYLIGHELSHYYFGNLVTPEWWSCIWLKEGFATMYAYYIMNMVHPDWNITEYYQTNVIQYAFKIDASESARPMNRDIKTLKDIKNNVDRIPYAKSSSVLSMFDNAITPEAFKKGIETFLTEMQMNSTKEEDLFKYLEQALEKSDSKINITKALGSWTSQAGFPLLTVDTKTKEIRLEQERFPNKLLSEYSIWSIPINFETPNGTDFNDTSIKFWMEAKTENFTVGDDITWDPSTDWIIFNVQQIGYYRVNYDLKNWELIIETLRNDYQKIHVKNRAQLIDDAFALAESNKLPYDVLLNLLQYLESEDAYGPWDAFDRGIEFLNINMGQPKTKKKFSKFLRKLLSRPFLEIGLNITFIENPLCSITRSIIVKHSCNCGVKECKDNSEDFNAPETRTTFYCNKLKSKKKESYFDMCSFIRTTEIKAIKISLLKAIGCYEDEHEIDRILMHTIKDNNMKLCSEEKMILFRSIFQNSLCGFQRSLIFLDKHCNALDSCLDSGDFNSLISEMSTYCQEPAEIKKMRKILTKVKITKESADTVKRNLVKTLDWSIRSKDCVEDWLYENEVEVSDYGDKDEYDDYAEEDDYDDNVNDELKMESSSSIKYLSFCVFLISSVVSFF